jgi:hypothetical protein
MAACSCLAQNQNGQGLSPRREDSRAQATARDHESSALLRALTVYGWAEAAGTSVTTVDRSAGKYFLNTA